MNQKARVCVISPEIVGPHRNGGVGTHCFYLTAFLSQQLGQQVTFAYTGWIETHDEAYWKDWFLKHLGVEFVWITPPDNLDNIPDGLKCAFVQTSRRVYEWLREREFEVCHFQEVTGNGFRCFQAKRLGLAFRNTLLTCTVHSSWEWICQAMQAWPHKGSEEMQAKFMERYCTEHCDVLISPSQYMLDWVAANEVKTPPGKFVLPYLFDPELRPVGHRPVAQHLIFFGRLEVRKGLLLFLETLLELDRQKAFADRRLEVTFLGKSGYTPGGGGLDSIKQFQARFSSNIHVTTLTDLGQPEALNYVREHNDALVVCPSLIDNSPFAIIESLQLGLNLIAAKSGGIPELFAGEDRLFEPEPGPLAAKLQAGLNNELPPPAKRYDLERSRQLWGDFCQRTLPGLREKAVAPGAASSQGAGRSPEVAVILAADHSGKPDSQVVKALEAQSFKGFSIKVERMGLDAKAAGNGAKANEGQGVPAAAGESYSVFLAPGCVPKPQLLEQLVRGLRSSPVKALSCCADVADPQGRQPPFVYEPLGACLEGGLFSNFFGLGCVIVRQQMGAIDPTLTRRLLQPQGLWSYLAELSLTSQAWDVCPEILVTLDRQAVHFSFADAPFTEQMEVVERYSETMPLWLRYLFLNAVGSERNLLAAENKLVRKEAEMQAISNLSPGKMLFKVKRETSRVVQQARALVKGKE